MSLTYKQVVEWLADDFRRQANEEDQGIQVYLTDYIDGLGKDVRNLMDEQARVKVEPPLDPKPSINIHDLLGHKLPEGMLRTDQLGQYRVHGTNWFAVVLDTDDKYQAKEKFFDKGEESAFERAMNYAAKLYTRGRLNDAEVARVNKELADTGRAMYKGVRIDLNVEDMTYVIVEYDDEYGDVEEAMGFIELIREQEGWAPTAEPGQSTEEPKTNGTTS